MATDDERRRAAANLRELAPGSEWPRAVAVACGMDTARMSGNFHEYTEQLCMRLADLIEPSEPKVKCVAEFDERVVDRHFVYCPVCGARVVE